MPSDYVLQIVHRPSGTVAAIEPGSRVETDLIDEVLNRAKAYGVGMFASESVVEVRLRQAWAELLHDLKTRVSPSRAPDM